MLDLTYVTQETITRFWAKVDKSGGPDTCWLWIGQCDKDGYGLFYPTRKTSSHASRVAWILERGPVSPGICVLHSCDTSYLPGDMTYRRCCNPDHLWIGTNNENMSDMARKGRVAKGERNGNVKLTDSKVLEIRAKWALGNVTQRQLTQEYGISMTPLQHILYRKSWKHI